MIPELEKLADDLKAAWPYARGARIAWYLIVDSGTQAVALIRMQQFSERIRFTMLAKAVRRLNFVLNGVDWVEGARAGGGLVLRHPFGVVVGFRTRIGRNVIILQGVTLGQRSFSNDGEAGNPCIGDNVSIGAHAVILGEISVGEGSVVGAGCVLTRSVKPRSTVVGNPARVLSGES